MRKKHLLAVGLSVLLAASLPFSALAASEKHDDGQQHTVSGDVKSTDPDEPAVLSENPGTEVTVTGNVEGEKIGAMAEAGGKADIGGNVSANTKDAVDSYGKDSEVTVGGDVKGGTGGNGVNAGSGGTVSVKGDVSTDSTNKSAVAAWEDATVNVGGNVDNTKADPDGERVPNAVLAQDNSTVTVGGNVDTTAYGVAASNSTTVEISGNVDAGLNGARAANSSTVNVTGNVTAGHDGVNAKGDNSGGTGAGSYVSVGGSVSSGGVAAHASDGSNVEIGKDAHSDNDNAVYAETSGSVKVGGNATSDSTQYGAVVAYDNAKVEVGGNVELNKTEVSGGAAAAGAVGSYLGSTVTIGGDVNTAGDGLMSTQNSSIDVAGSVNAGVRGVEADVSSTITVGKDVTAKQGTAVVTEDNGTVKVGGNVTGGTEGVKASESSTVEVKGDVKGDKSAVSTDSTSKIKVEGSVKGGDGISITESSSTGSGSVVVLGTVQASRGDYCVTVTGSALSKQEVVDALPTIIVGELKASGGNYVEYQDKAGNSSVDTKAMAEAIAEQILYLIDVQETQNGKVSVTDGTKQVQGYEVAHANDKVTISVTADSGYEIQSVSGGKATAVKNADGSWSITVPQSGGVSISAIMQALNIVNQNTGGDSGDDLLAKGEGTPQSGQQGGEVTVNLQAKDGSAAPVVGLTANEAAGQALGLVKEEGTRAHIGTEKISGLPAAAINAIRQLDQGNLSTFAPTALSAQVTGKRVFAKTIAVETAATGKQLKLYTAGFPDGAAPVILFYNNRTGQWESISATLDPVTGYISFFAPGLGTLAVLY